MTNIQLMRKCLETKVIQPLIDQGYIGKYPHFKREKENCIELITFQTNKHGGSFTVEVSAVFPNKENKNYVLYNDKEIKDLNVWDTNIRYRLKGMYDGWFYYRDLYSKYIFGFGKDYIDISENKTPASVPAGYKLVQKFDENTANQICQEVNKQLTKAFKWLQKFEKTNQNK